MIETNTEKTTWEIGRKVLQNMSWKERGMFGSFGGVVVLSTAIILFVGLTGRAPEGPYLSRFERLNSLDQLKEDPTNCRWYVDTLQRNRKSYTIYCR